MDILRSLCRELTQVPRYSAHILPITLQLGAKIVARAIVNFMHSNVEPTAVLP